MHEWERIRSLPSKEKLEKAWRILEEQVWSEIRVFWERNKEVLRERSKENDFWITQMPYIEQLVNLNRCRYREVSRDLSRRCRENAHRQLRCREGIEEQHIKIKKRNLIDPSGVEKLSRRQELSRSIHQVSRRCQDCVKKKAWEARQIARYRGGVEPAFQNSFSREEKHRYECNPTFNLTNDPINTKISWNSLLIKNKIWAQGSPKHTHTHTTSLTNFIFQK